MQTQTPAGVHIKVATILGVTVSLLLLLLLLLSR